MRITGSNVVPHPVGQVWDALLDPRVLVTTIPGCERLEATGENAYAMTVTAGVAAVKGTYTGGCALTDLKRHESLVMNLRGAGAPGTVDAVVDVAFDDLGPEGTRISYAADATVGGMVGGVGQRMLASVSKRMAAEFFGNVGTAIGAPVSTPDGPAAQAASAGAGPGSGTGVAATEPGVFTAPPPLPGRPGELTRGIGIGAAVALLGVLVGAAIGRRR
ncbi:carbon monoxide dehydrogenase subunit G [Pseudonocardia nematodicida]|uniref:Carbon monoxide dehydrogenase subunit G n=1 Tax=Pseudonocardia nematodicida TaxID=1206997 RepID=A0ABV1K980_9PSEU